MSASNKMTLRVQGPEGTVRVEASGSDTAAELWERVSAASALPRAALLLCRDRARRDVLPADGTPLRALRPPLQHGDMLYLSHTPAPAPRDEAQPSTSTQQLSAKQPHATAGSAVSAPQQQPVEDDVDLELYQLDGTIQRGRDDKLCRHSSRGCCVHCSPLEPWHEQYLQEHNIKHMSFHSYLRKLSAGKSFVSLEELSCRIRPGCVDHPPWPRGVCSKCQPPAVTLTRQVYRHVDNVLVEHPSIVERFLSAWRSTGQQRVGWLYGRYERHVNVPLGVRATVAAIYEPPQRADRDSVILAPHDPKEEALDQLTRALGLRRVGWIFTDLVVDRLEEGTVRCVRNANTHLLSAQEVITAGHYQNKHPNACRHATSGYYGSKFVTVCVTGDDQRQVALEGWQVSAQCAALVRDDVLVPTRDAPDLGYVRESSEKQYVPDVLYKRRDQYGNDVGVAARRVPTAYVLVDVPAGVAAAPKPLLTPSGAAALPPAHRDNQPQSLRALQAHVAAAPDILTALADLHVLLYLCTNEALPLDVATIEPLLAAVRANDVTAAQQAVQSAPQLATLLELARAATDAPPDAATWTCPLCTFHNAAHHDACDMCAMPRNSA